MEAVLKRIAEIEQTAEAIVSEAENQKSTIEKDIQQQRDAFDKELHDRTEAQISEIRKHGEERLKAVVEEERRKNHQAIDNLEKEYEEHHTEYAKEVMDRIIKL